MPNTPMVWEKDAAHAGFSDASRTWLPVPESHLRQAVDQQDHLSGSLLNHYRQTLAFRKSHGSLIDGPMTFLETNGDLLAFTTGRGQERLLFVFNLDRDPVEWTPPSDLQDRRACEAAGVRPGPRGRYRDARGPRRILRPARVDP
jgi:alpha-glucosidase